MPAPFANTIITNDGAILDLQALRPTLNGSFMRLFKNNVVPTHLSNPTTFVECDFVGYAPISPPFFGAPYINGFGKAETDTAVLQWIFAAGLGTQTAFGWYLTDPTGIAVIAAAQFVPPFGFTPTNTTLSMVVELTAVSEL